MLRLQRRSLECPFLVRSRHSTGVGSIHGLLRRAAQALKANRRMGGGCRGLLLLEPVCASRGWRGRRQVTLAIVLYVTGFSFLARSSAAVRDRTLDRMNAVLIDINTRFAVYPWMNLRTNSKYT